MKTILTEALGLLMVVALSAQISRSQQNTGKGKGGLHVVATREVAAIVSSGNAKERITGRVSFNLTTNAEDGPKDQVRVQSFNIAFFGVPQRLIAGGAPVEEPLGMLGFAVVPSSAALGPIV